jgi:tetratricopeptide (TPR) repeat protein
VNYKLVLQRDDLNIQAHNNLGVLYRDKGLFEDAIRHFQRALAIDPKNVESMVHLSTVEKTSGRKDEARQWLARAMLIDPHNPEALYNLGLLEDEAGNSEQAQSLYRAFLEYGAASHPALVAQVRARIDALAAR